MWTRWPPPWPRSVGGRYLKGVGLPTICRVASASTGWGGSGARSAMAAEWEGLEILLQDWVLNGRLNAQKAEVR